MKTLVQMFGEGVTSVESHTDGASFKGIKINFADNTNLWIEHNACFHANDDKLEISVWGTSVNGLANTRLVLNTHTLTKAKLVVQELNVIIEEIEKSQS